MSKPTLINDNEFSRIYRIQNGEAIHLILEDDYSKIEFINSQKEKIGLFEFIELDDFSSDYKLSYMYSDIKDAKYKRKGLGETALIYFKEMTDANIYTSPYDGQVIVDGSHLTGDAPFFVSKMKQKGIISGDYPNTIEGDNDNGFIDL